MIYRKVGTFVNNLSANHLKEKIMEILIPLGVVAAWVILQAWVLPRFGVKT
jgi:hypothetical protein